MKISPYFVYTGSSQCVMGTYTSKAVGNYYHILWEDTKKEECYSIEIIDICVKQNLWVPAKTLQEVLMIKIKHSK
jgi:hypothetical protein